MRHSRAPSKTSLTPLQHGELCCNKDRRMGGGEERGGRLPRMSVNPARLIKARLAATWKRENALFTDSSLSLSFSLLKLSFCFPAWKKIQRERERDSRCREMDGKLSVRLCFERVVRDCKQDLSFCFSLVWKSKFVWEARGGEVISRERK